MEVSAVDQKACLTARSAATTLLNFSVVPSHFCSHITADARGISGMLSFSSSYTRNMIFHPNENFKVSRLRGLNIYCIFVRLSIIFPEV
jgi:hypothetical protein